MSFQAILAEYEARRAKALAGGGEDKYAKRKQAGMWSARDRIASLLDKGTFIESGLFGSSGVYPEQAEETQIPFALDRLPPSVEDVAADHAQHVARGEIVPAKPVEQHEDREDLEEGRGVKQHGRGAGPAGWIGGGNGNIKRRESLAPFDP